MPDVALDLIKCSKFDNTAHNTKETTNLGNYIGFLFGFPIAGNQSNLSMSSLIC